MNVTQQALSDDPPSLGDHPALVIPTYLVVFLPWAIVQTIDFISSEWKTVQQTRRQGLIHMFILIVPVIILSVYIYFQHKAKDYKEMSAAILAIIISMTQLMRTWWGLWQLEEFKKWATQAIRIMESHGYRYELSDTGSDLEDMKKINDSHVDTEPTVEEEESNNSEDEVSISHDSRQPELNDPEQRDDIDDYITWKTEQVEKCETKAEQIKVNESVIDNQIAGGATRCYVKFRDTTLLKLPTQQERRLLAYMVIPLDFIIIFLVRMLVDPIVCLSKLFKWLKPLAKRYNSRMDNLMQQKPHEPVEVWINWAAVFVSQGLKDWITNFHVLTVPLPQDGVTADGYMEHRDYFAGEVLSMGLLMMENSDTRYESSANGNGIMHHAGRYGPASHLRYLQIATPDNRSRANEEANNECFPMRRVRKQDLFVKALESGKGLPFYCSHLIPIDADKKLMNDNSSRKGSLRGQVEFNSVVQNELRRDGYKPYEHDLKRTVELLPPKFGSEVLDFDIERLEWLTILLFLGINDHNKSDGETYSTNGSSTRDVPPEEKRTYKLTESDTPVKMLKLQLGFHLKPELLRLNSHGKQRYRALTLPLEKIDHLQLSQSNRNVTRVSEAIDVWIALDAGASFNFLLQHEKDMEVECLHGQPENHLFTSRDTIQWEHDCDISDRESYHKAVEYAKKVDEEWNPLMVSHVVAEQRRLEAEFGMKSRGRGDYSQSFSFLGIMMEHVRSSLARRVEKEGEDCLTPEIPFRDGGLVTSEIANFQLSESLGCAIEACLSVSPGSESGPKPWSDLLKGRLILELQEHCRMMLRDEDEMISVGPSMSGSGGSSTSTMAGSTETVLSQDFISMFTFGNTGEGVGTSSAQSSLETRDSPLPMPSSPTQRSESPLERRFDEKMIREVACILGFPSIYVSELGNCNGRTSIRGSTEIDFRYVCSIYSVCGPQYLSIEVDLKKMENVLVASVRLARKEVIRDSHFEWEAWRDAHLGRLEGKRQWQVVHEIRSEPLCLNNSELRRGVGWYTLSSKGIGEKMNVFNGWKPIRPKICEFEFKSKGLILTDQYFKSKDEVTEQPYHSDEEDKMHQRVANEKGLRRVPVSYDNAATNVLTYTADVIARILSQTSDKELEETLSDEGEGHGTIHKLTMNQVEKLLEAGNRQYALQILENEIEDRRLDALEKAILVLTNSGCGKHECSQAILFLQRFQSLPLFSSRFYDDDDRVKREMMVEKLVSLYEKLTMNTDYHSKVLASFSKFLRNVLGRDGQRYMWKFMRYIRISFHHTGNEGVVRELAFWSMRRDDGRRRVHLDEALVRNILNTPDKEIINLENAKFHITNVALHHRTDATPYFRFRTENGDLEAILDGANAIKIGALDCDEAAAGVIEQCGKPEQLGKFEEEKEVALRDIVRYEGAKPKHQRHALDLLQEITDRQNNRNAPFLIDVFERGTSSITPDLQQTINIYNKANDSFLDHRTVFRIVRNGSGVSSSESSNALQYLESQATTNPVLRYELSLLYENGTRWIEPNISKALHHYGIVAKGTNVSHKKIAAANALLRILQTTLSLNETDRKAALQSLARAAYDNKWISYEVGMLYEKGKASFPRDMHEAVKYYGIAGTNHDAIEALSRIIRDESETDSEYQQKSLEKLHAAAEAGSLGAALILGSIYEQGNSWINRDLSKAIDIYRKYSYDRKCCENLVRLLQQDSGSNSNHCQKVVAILRNCLTNCTNNVAKFHLGLMLEKGTQHLDKDISEAIKLYEKSISYKESRNSLVRIIQESDTNGSEHQRDAFEILRRAAPDKSRGANRCLGAIYEYGASWIPINMTEAVRMYSKSRHRDREFFLDADLMRVMGDHLYSVTEHSNQVLTAFQSAAIKHSTIGIELGLILESGTEAVGRDLTKSIHIYGSKAAKGYKQPAFALNRILHQYNDIEEHAVEKAIDSLKNCITYKSDRRDIRRKLGYLYEHGIATVERNMVEAVRWYHHVNDGFRWAPNNHILRIIRLDEHIDRDHLQMSLRLLKEATEKEDKEAMLILANLHEYGTSLVTQDMYKASTLYKRAALKGSQEAIEFLFRMITDNCFSDLKLTKTIVRYIQDISHEENSFLKEESSLTNRLGRIYEHSNSVIQCDMTEAVRFYAIACRKGNLEAHNSLLRVLLGNADAYATCKEIAIRCMWENASHATDNQVYYSSSSYHQMSPNDKNMFFAVINYGKTAAIDLMDSVEGLIRILKAREIQNEQKSVALRLLRTLISSNNDNAIYHLGSLHEYGTASNGRNIFEAVRLYMMACDRDSRCRNAIIRILRDRVDIDEAVIRDTLRYVQQADSNSCRAITGSLWEHGNSIVEKDVMQAVHIYGNGDISCFARDFVRLLLEGVNLTPTSQKLILWYMEITGDSLEKKNVDDLGKLFPFLQPKSSVKALHLLGNLYEHGTELMAQNVSESMRVYKQMVYARSNLGWSALLRIVRDNRLTEPVYTKDTLRLLENTIRQVDNVIANEMALLHEHGIASIECSTETAAKIYKIRARIGSRDSLQALVRTIYDETVEKSVRERALRCITDASDTNDDAKYTLGYLYEHGSNVLSRDLFLALRIYAKASANKHKESSNALLRLARTSTEIRATRKETLVQCLWGSATNGNTDMARSLGLLYEQGGLLVSRKLSKAIQLYGLSAIHGNWDSFKALICIMCDESSDETHRKKALYYIQRAGFRSDSQITNAVASLYKRGVGYCDTDLNKAIRLYCLAAESGDSTAPTAIIQMLHHSVVEAGCKDFALRSLSTIAMNGNADLAHQLGCFYEDGTQGLSHNLPQAARFYSVAAAHEHPGGLTRLIRLVTSNTLKDEVQRRSILLYLHESAEKSKQAAYELAYIYEKGTTWLNYDISKAVRVYGKTAIQGHQDSTRALIRLFCSDSDTLETHRDDCLHYLKEAVDSNNSDAAYHLAQLYENGKMNLPKDMNEAVRLYGVATIAKHSESTKALFRLLCDDSCAESGHQETILRFLRIAVSEEHEDAAYKLGTMYEDGTMSGGRDIVKAVRLYCTAACVGHLNSMTALASFLRGERGGESTYHQIILPHFRRAVIKENGNAAYLLGSLYEKGMKEIAADLDEAIRLYGNAGIANDEKGTNALLRVLREKEIWNESQKHTALVYLRVAALHGNHLAMYELGCLQEIGNESIPINMSEAVRLFGNASAAGDEASTKKLCSLLHENQEMLLRDQQSCLHSLEIAADKGNAVAAYELGCIYESGLNWIEENLTEAIRFYGSAALKEHAESLKSLKRIVDNEKLTKRIRMAAALDLDDAKQTSEFFLQVSGEN